MEYSGSTSVSPDSLPLRNSTAALLADDANALSVKQDDLAVLMKTLNHRYNQYLKRQDASAAAAAPVAAATTATSSCVTDFLNDGTAPPAGGEYGMPLNGAAMPRAPGTRHRGHPVGGSSGSQGDESSFLVNEDDAVGPELKNTSGILSATLTNAGTGATLPMMSSMRKSPGSIVLPQRTGEYWGERELYMAAEDVCRYLNGGVNYRQMCMQYRRVLDLLLTMIREDVSLAQTLLSSSASSPSAMAGAPGQDEVGVTEDLRAVDRLLRELRSLLQESKQLLKENGVELPASFANGLLNDPYTVMSTSSLGAPSGHRGPQNHRSGLPSSSSAANNTGALRTVGSVGGGGMGRAYAGRPGSREDGNRAASGGTRQINTPSSVAIVPDPVPDAENDLSYPPHLQGGGGGSGGYPHSGYTPLVNGELASLLKPVSQYSQPSQQQQQQRPSSGHHHHHHHTHHGQPQQQQQQQQQAGGGILCRSGSAVADSSTKGGGYRRSSLSTAHDPSIGGGTAHPTRSALFDDSFTDGQAKGSAAPALGGPDDFLHATQEDANPSINQSAIATSTAAATTATTGAPAAAEAPPATASLVASTPPPAVPTVTAAAGDAGDTAFSVARALEEMETAEDVLAAGGLALSSVEAMRRDRLRRLQLVYSDGYPLSGMEFLLDAMGLVFREEYDQGDANVDVKQSFAAFRKDVVDRVLPPLETYEGFRATTSEATPLRSVYLTLCIQGRTKPNEKLLDALTGSEDRDVEELHLSGAKLGDKGVTAVLGVLPRLHRLRKLDLSHNELHDGVMPAIAQAVSHRPALTTVVLSFNDFTNSSLPSLVAMAHTVPRLREIAVQGCDLSPEAKSLLAAELASPQPTSTAALGLRPIPYTGALAAGATLRAGSAPTLWSGRQVTPSPARPGGSAAHAAPTAARKRQYLPLASLARKPGAKGGNEESNLRSGVVLPHIPSTDRAESVPTHTSNPRVRSYLRGGGNTSAANSRSGSVVGAQQQPSPLAIHGGGVRRRVSLGSASGANGSTGALPPVRRASGASSSTGAKRRVSNPKKSNPTP